MESPANPYSTPAANLYGASTGGGADTVAASTIAQLAGTKPWIRFMSVIMWIAFGLLGFFSASTALMATSGVFSSPEFLNSPGIADNPMFASNPKFMTQIMLGQAIYLGVFALLTIYPALKLWNYANRIGQLIGSHATVDLDAALAEQRRFWKFSGIMTIIGICLVIIGFVAFFAMIITAVQSGMRVPR
ncbi:DUF5362 family protein [Prosthecobacter sp.]|uniref:DUF5362 family protein n=1 Tax=Prosthecobacter sp. TaxID=1965333 RepID=UPI00378303D3